VRGSLVSAIGGAFSGGENIVRTFHIVVKTHRPAPSHSAAVGLILLSAALWSLGGIGIKQVEWSAPAIAATRGLIAAATILAWMRGRLHFTWSRWQLGAAACYAGTTLLFVFSNKLTTAANAILLQYTAPIYVALLAPRWLGERSRPGDWISVLVTLAGMGLFFLDELDAEASLGNLLAIASGVTLAGMILCLRKQKHGSPVESAVLGNLVVALCGLPFLHGPWPDAGGWTWLVVLGVIQLGLGYLAYAHAVRSATAMEATLLPMIEPVLNPIWVLLAIGEVPGRFALIGGAVVLGTVAWRAMVALRFRVTARLRVSS
jgi:drug/metabolite transporter (DMT)-like permease